MSLVLPEQKVALCESNLGVSFRNKSLCLEALQMQIEPVRWENTLLEVVKNDRLAVLGMNVMKAYFCKQWYDSKRPKGLWSLAEQDVLKSANLARIGMEKGLDSCILTSALTKISPNMMATTLQALVGAVFIEGGETAMAKLLQDLGLTHNYFKRPDISAAITSSDRQ